MRTGTLVPIGTKHPTKKTTLVYTHFGFHGWQWHNTWKSLHRKVVPTLAKLGFWGDGFHLKNISNIKTGISWQFFVTFLGWLSHPVKGCWWPPTIGDKKVTAWMTWFLFLAIVKRPLKLKKNEHLGTRLQHHFLNGSGHIHDLVAPWKLLHINRVCKWRFPHKHDYPP